MEQERARSLSQAKHMLRALEMKKGTTNREMLGEYTDVLNHVVDVISKLTTDDDCCSDTSLTVPETIVSSTDDSSTMSFLLCGGAVGHHDEEVTQRWIDDGDTDSGYWKRDDSDCNRDDAADSDDDLSVSSDCVPLYMTDEDAIDEIDFTRELMGYVEGFEAHDMPISRIEEEEERDVPVATSSSQSPRSSSKRLRPPLPTRAQSHGTKSSSGTAPVPKLKKGHRRQHSGGSIPTIMEKKDPRRFRRPSFSHQSLPERRMISCSICRRRTVEGEVCDCGKWEI